MQYNVESNSTKFQNMVEERQRLKPVPPSTTHVRKIIRKSRKIIYDSNLSFVCIRDYNL